MKIKYIYFFLLFILVFILSYFVLFNYMLLNEWDEKVGLVASSPFRTYTFDFYLYFEKVQWPDDFLTHIHYIPSELKYICKKKGKHSKIYYVNIFKSPTQNIQDIIENYKTFSTKVYKDP